MDEPRTNEPEADQSINDEFAPPVSPDPATPPEKEPLGGQPMPERDETGPYGLDREGTEPIDEEEAGGGVPDSEYGRGQPMRPTDAGREEANQAWGETRGGWEETTDR
jgi:hypothetical protein